MFTMIDSAKVEVISKSLDSLVSKVNERLLDKPSIWTTIIPILIGASLALATQFFIEIFKSSKDKKKRKQELISKGKAKMYLIGQILKDLAMYKVHKQYYMRSYYLETNQVEKEDSIKKHYEKGQEQRITETKLDDSISDYFQIATEYSIITNNNDYFDKLFDPIFHYAHPKSSKFTNCTINSQLEIELVKEEQRLNTEYEIYFSCFKVIQATMK